METKTFTAGNDLTEEYFPTVYKAWVQHPAPALPERKNQDHP